MDQATQIINRVLPILFLILLGNQMRQRQFVSEQTINDLRKIVINCALPSVLFLSFVQIELKPAYLFIFVLIFLLSLIMFGLGSWLRMQFQIEHSYFRFLMTGFEYGMLGVSLFGSAYGLEKIGYFAILDVGHEIFIWFVFLAFLLMQRDGIQEGKQLLQAFFKAPVILAVLLGLVLNALGFRNMLFNAPVTGGLTSTLQFLANLTIPVMLLLIGYNVRMDISGLKEALPIILIRLAILMPLAFLLGFFVIRKWLMLQYGFEIALFTLLVLPPPFIIPLYMHPDQVTEKKYVNNTLAIYTVVSIIIFVIYFILHPSIS